MLDRNTRHLITMFGADFAVNKPEPPSRAMSAMQRQVARNKLNRAVTAEGGREYEFPPDGGTARATVLWPQFYRPTHQARVAMRRALLGCQLNPFDVAHVWAVCDELREPPLPELLAASLAYTKTALELAGSEHVLLVGSQVLGLWSNRAKITRVAGHGYVWGRYYVYPTYHPLALNHQLTMDQWRQSFQKLTWGLQEGSIIDVLDTGCHDKTCDKQGVVFDAKARAWCETHYSPGGISREDTKWNVMQNQSQQQKML